MTLKLTVVSNLASPYAEPAQKWLSSCLDAEVWSFEVGHIKPEPEIYAITADRLGCTVTEVLFVGDSPACDLAGPRRAGLRSILLDRRGRYSELSSLSYLSKLSDVVAAALNKRQCHS